MQTSFIVKTSIRRSAGHRLAVAAVGGSAPGVRRHVPVFLACVLALAMPGAWASEMERRAPVVPDPQWQAECGSCHVAYPPALLAKGDWRRVMATLDRHFGTDASVDPAIARHIAAFLEQNGGREQAEVPPAGTPRITQTRWFLREHREVPAQVWTRASVGSAANCTACHTGAAAGDFRERNIRIPTR